MRKAQMPKNANQGDWHPADIQAALRKKGWSYAQLSLFHGYTKSANSALSQAARKPYPKAERLIADAIGVHPAQIWPSRYDEHGRPNRKKGRAIRPAKIKLVRSRPGEPVKTRQAINVANTTRLNPTRNINNA